LCAFLLCDTAVNKINFNFSLVKSFNDLQYVKMRLEILMNETMFKNCFLVTKNKNKNILA